MYIYTYTYVYYHGKSDVKFTVLTFLSIQFSSVCYIYSHCETGLHNFHLANLKLYNH